jgi:hypothetical protein
LERLKHLADLRNEGLSVLQTVAPCPEEHNTKTVTRHMLLVFQTAIHGNQCIEFTACQLEQLAVLLVFPAAFCHGAHFNRMRKAVSEPVVQMFVKQNAHGLCPQGRLGGPALTRLPLAHD